MSKFVDEVSDQSFDSEVLGAETPVLVDFWAAWCGPCRMLAPTVDRLAEEFGDRLKVVKLDIDASAATSTRFGIKSIPTLVLFKNGSEQDRLIGNQPKEAIAQMISRHVA
jgi:thioredoxin 1